jgi:threonine/homoserine/homoserine lactone efflux protein
MAIGALFGLFAGMAPGPYTTMVVATALERGFRSAVPLAFAPLLTDLVPLAATAYLLTALSETAVSAMAMIGGVVVTGIGIRLLVRYGGAPSDDVDEGPRAAPTIRFWHVVTSTLVSPAPWLFWLGVASPILVRRWNTDWRLGAAFVVTLFVVNIGSASALAWAASHGRRVLAPYWRHRVLRIMAVALMGAGILLVVQGASGGEMGVDPDFVEEVIPGLGQDP